MVCFTTRTLTMRLRCSENMRQKSSIIIQLQLHYDLRYPQTHFLTEQIASSTSFSPFLSLVNLNQFASNKNWCLCRQTVHTHIHTHSLKTNGIILRSGFFFFSVLLMTLAKHRQPVSQLASLKVASENCTKNS